MKKLSSEIAYFKNSVIFGLKNSFNFKGETNRRDCLYYLIFVYGLIFLTLFSCKYIGNQYFETSVEDGGMLIGMLLCSPLIVSIWSTFVRRLHDIGWAGYLIFVTFIPLIGLLFFLVLILKEGKKK